MVLTRRSNLEAKRQSEISRSDPQARLTGRWPDAKAHRIFWSIVIIGTGADLWSKWAVFKWLSDVPGREYFVIDGLFKMVMRLNYGAAFSIAQGRTGMLVAVSVVAMVAVLGIFIFGRVHQRIIQVALALFAAGITGNLYDRAFNEGAVRDFLDFYVGNHHWPAFNVADSMLCIAVGLLIICNIMSEVYRKRDHSQKTEP